MRSEIDDYVKDNFPEQSAQLIDQAFDLFDEYDLPEYAEQYIGLLMTADNNDTAMVRDNFYGQVMKDLDLILKSHDVVLFEEAPLEVVIEVVRAIRTLQDYSDKQEINNIVNELADSEEKFCELLELVTPYSTDFFLSHVEKVSKALLELLASQTNEEAYFHDTDSEVDSDQINKILSRLKMIALMPDMNKTLGFGLIMADTPLGADFEFYANRVLSALEEKSSLELGNELAVLLAMSRDGFTHPQQTFQKWSVALGADLTRISAANIALNNTITRIESFATSQKNK